MKIRKAVSFLIVIVTAFSLFGCKAFGDDPKRIEKEDAVQIFEYLKNEDIDSLCGLFSKEASAKHSIRSEWESFFARVDGKIVSYKGIKYPGEGVGKEVERICWFSTLARCKRNLETGQFVFCIHIGGSAAKCDLMRRGIIYASLLALRNAEILLNCRARR